MFRDLTLSKAQRSSLALHEAARLAEQRKEWYSAAELYEGAASLCAEDGDDLLRRAEQCRSLCGNHDDKDI